MSWPVVDIAAFQFEPVGNNTGGAPESVLKSTMQIGTCMFHVEAYQVEDRDGEFVAVNQDYSSELDCIYQLNGAGLTSVQINGLEYVLVVFPFG